MKSLSSTLDEAVATTRPAIIAMIALGVFVNLALLTPPLYMLQVYDRVLSSSNIGTLIMLSLIAFAMLCVFGILEFARNAILVRASAQFDEHLSPALFKIFATTPRRDNASLGGQALKDAATLRDTLSSGTLCSLSDVPWTPFFILICWLMHPVLGGVALGAACLILAVALLADVLARGAMARSNTWSIESARISTATLNSVDAVRGLGMGQILHSRWQKHHFAMVSELTKANECSKFTLSLSKFIRLAVQAVMLGTGAWLAVEREISPGVMIAASILMGRALAPIEQVVGNWQRIVSARAAYARLSEVFKLVPPSQKRFDLPKPEGRINVENVSIVPPGSNQPVVRALNFTLNPGDCLAVVGRSGSGKSSLARALCGVWMPRGGTIRMDGISLDQFDQDVLGGHIGYLPQDTILFDGTISENIARLQDAKPKEVLAAAKISGTHEAILKLPDGYDTQIGTTGMTLSGGMRQRVGLARALFRSPALVVLDEPNANLDTDGDISLARSLKALKSAGATVIVVTHKPQLLVHVDKVLVMSEGRLQAFGPRDEVLKPRNARPSDNVGNDVADTEKTAA